MSKCPWNCRFYEGIIVSVFYLSSTMDRIVYLLGLIRRDSNIMTILILMVVHGGSQDDQESSY